MYKNDHNSTIHKKQKLDTTYVHHLKNESINCAIFILQNTLKPCEWTNFNDMEQNRSTTQTQWGLIKRGTKENTLHGSINKKFQNRKK